MNMTQGRGAVYATSFVTGLATLAALAGYATFDTVTGTFDLLPVNVYAVLPFIGTIVASGMAWIAVIFGWGKK
jgi:hypothetical protein